jgi:hypothetical protein
MPSIEQLEALARQQVRMRRDVRAQWLQRARDLRERQQRLCLQRAQQTQQGEQGQQEEQTPQQQLLRLLQQMNQQQQQEEDGENGNAFEGEEEEEDEEQEVQRLHELVRALEEEDGEEGEVPEEVRQEALQFYEQHSAEHQLEMQAFPQMMRERVQVIRLAVEQRAGEMRPVLLKSARVLELYGFGAQWDGGMEAWTAILAAGAGAADDAVEEAVRHAVNEACRFIHTLGCVHG